MAELCGLADVGSASPPAIHLINMAAVPSALLPPTPEAPYGAYTGASILVEQDLPPLALRSAIRHELCHWWQQITGRDVYDESFPSAFGRDPTFRRQLEAHLAGRPPAPPGMTYALDRLDDGTLDWTLRPRSVRLVFHGATEASLTVRLGDEVAVALPARRGPALSNSGVFDSDEPFDHFFVLPDRIGLIVDAVAWFRFREFTAPAKSAVSSGTLTSDSGGGSTTVSGGGATSGNPGGLPTAGGTDHLHRLAAWVSDTAGAFTNRKYSTSNVPNINVEASNQNDIYVESEGTHFHTLPGHTHSTPNHQHATPNHQHTVPGHTHGLTYGIFKEAMPGSIDVNVGVYIHESEAWQFLGTFSGIKETEIMLDLSPFVDRAGLYRLTLQSAPAQPNGGRLSVDVTGFIMGAIQSE